MLHYQHVKFPMLAEQTFHTNVHIRTIHTYHIVDAETGVGVHAVLFSHWSERQYVQIVLLVFHQHSVNATVHHKLESTERHITFYGFFCRVIRSFLDAHEKCECLAEFFLTMIKVKHDPFCTNSRVCKTIPRCHKHLLLLSYYSCFRIRIHALKKPAIQFICSANRA